MSAPIVTFFNNKGGVGKTSTLFNLSSMFARRGKRVLAVDLDPQANLTSLALADEVLERLWDDSDSAATSTHQTIFDAIQPLMEGVGDVKAIQPQALPNMRGYSLIPGDLRLSQFEDQLAQNWNAVLGGKTIGLNITSAFARLMQRVAAHDSSDVVFIDVGPNLGAINRAGLIASDYVIIPLVPDLFSLQGLVNVGKFLLEWRKDGQDGRRRADTQNKGYPVGKMEPLGYIILQHRERQSRLVASHQRWADRIPETYTTKVLRQSGGAITPDPNFIGQVRNYQSLMALSHESRKPVFDLKPADGAIGSHYRVVQEAEKTYYELAQVVATRIGLSFD